MSDFSLYRVSHRTQCADSHGCLREARCVRLFQRMESLLDSGDALRGSAQSFCLEPPDGDELLHLAKCLLQHFERLALVPVHVLVAARRRRHHLKVCQQRAASPGITRSPIKESSLVRCFPCFPELFLFNSHGSGARAEA
eukprot:scaffold313916_cov31-Tisochrysis_lutea.AAC.3